jgi:hypothetical protein
MTNDDLAGLPETIHELGWLLFGLRRIPDIAVACELLEWQRLEIEILESHADWLAEMKAAVEGSGVDWTIGNLNRFCRFPEVD